MAIAFVNSTSGISGSSGVGLGYDSGGVATDKLLILGVGSNIGLVSVTYAGASLTFIGTAGTGTPGENLQLWGLVAPATGSNNIVVTTLDSLGWEGAVATYSGAAGGVQGTPATSSNQSSPMALTILTLTDNSWLTCFVRNTSGNNAAGANTTLRGANSPLSILDTNAAQTPIGTYSLNISWGGGGTAGGIGTAIGATAAPAVSAFHALPLLGVGK